MILGIGVILIGVALLILAIVLIKPLSKLADVLGDVKTTTEALPEIVDNTATEAHTALKNVNTALENVNAQITTVNPFLHIVEDVGHASRNATANWLTKSTQFKATTEDAKEFGEEKKFQGLYGLLSFFFYLSQNKDALMNASKQFKK